MKRKIIITLLVCIIALSALTACGNDYTEISINAAGEKLSYLVVNYENDPGNRFPEYFEQYDIPYVEIGSEFVIEFPNGAPDSYQILDRVIYGDGVYKYAEREVIGPSSEKDGNSISFTLPVNVTAFYDSSILEQEYIYRGIRINCVYGNDEYRYDFVIKTDVSRVVEGA